MQIMYHSLVSMLQTHITFCAASGVLQTHHVLICQVCAVQVPQAPTWSAAARRSDAQWVMLCDFD
jgi:hypothetical protein